MTCKCKQTTSRFNNKVRKKSKLTNDAVLKYKLMSSFTDRHIYPNSELETKLKSGKFHKAKNLRSKRKTALFNTFEEKEAFVKTLYQIRQCKSLSCKHRQ